MPSVHSFELLEGAVTHEAPKVELLDASGEVVARLTAEPHGAGYRFALDPDLERIAVGIRLTDAKGTGTFPLRSDVEALAALLTESFDKLP